MIQLWLLTIQGDKQANLKKVWDRDLLQQLDEWRKGSSEIVLMVDANSSIEDKAFGEFLAESKLFDMTGAKHGIHSPKTHINGSKAIDFLCRMEIALKIVLAIGMLAFFVDIMSDHRG
eukprot:15342347-Ditylum_brightwellii.AAC.1